MKKLATLATGNAWKTHRDVHTMVNEPTSSDLKGHGRLNHEMITKEIRLHRYPTKVYNGFRPRCK